MFDYTQYPAMSNAMSPIQYTPAAQRLVPVTTTTRKVTKPVVVDRSKLIEALQGATGEYKKALEENNDIYAALGKAVSDEQAARALAAPTNKGRLESKMSGWQALAGGLMQGLNTYGKMSQAQENKAAKEYENALKIATLEDALQARQEAADLQNAINNQVVTVEGMEKLNEQKDAGKDSVSALRPLDPTLGQQIRSNPDAFGLTARLAESASTKENPSTWDMIKESAFKEYQGDENLKVRNELLQQTTEVVNAIVALSRSSGSAASMMNSDKEGQRALSRLSSPDKYSAEELAAAVETATNMYNNALKQSGMYEKVYNSPNSYPEGSMTAVPSNSTVNYSGTKTNNGYAW